MFMPEIQSNFREIDCEITASITWVIDEWITRLEYDPTDAHFRRKFIQKLTFSRN
jgi:hypothetical protein